MQQSAERTVVVAVAGTDVGPALTYTAADVRRRGGRVHVAHVVPALDLLGVPEPTVVEGDTLRRAGAAVVDEVTTELERMLPDTIVAAVLLHGAAVPELVRCARGADRTVLLRGARGWRRAVTLSTSNGVAAHARGPVVVVPSYWSPDADRERSVVVAVDDVLSVPGVVEAALEEAAARGGKIRVVHAWRFADTYEEVVLTGETARLQEEEIRRDLTRELHVLVKRHPEVEVEIVVTHAHAADLLVRESAAAGLLVMGRHRPALPVGPHLGSVVRAVLREAECPVLVVAPSRSA
jgi:nucleotide-binding universal stress UspA family protein